MKKHDKRLNKSREGAHKTRLFHPRGLNARNSTVLFSSSDQQTNTSIDKRPKAKDEAAEQ
jgi:hypothetical protein